MRSFHTCLHEKEYVGLRTGFAENRVVPGVGVFPTPILSKRFGDDINLIFQWNAFH
jgi:hypothetical protein